MRYKFIFPNGVEICTLFRQPQIGEKIYYCDTVVNSFKCTCDNNYIKGFGIVAEMNEDTIWLEEE